MRAPFHSVDDAWAQTERQRLARLLHDRVQHLLVAAKMRVDLVAATIGEPQRGKLTDVVTILNEAIAATRDFSVQLAPPLLHDQGLVVALEWLANRKQKLYGSLIQLHLDPGAEPATENSRDILIHVAQEFLLNAVKHSGAQEFELHLFHNDEFIRLIVEDRGIGFDPSRAVQQGAFGLLQLRQRLESAGGSLVMESSPGKGTRAIASLPVEA